MRASKIIDDIVNGKSIINDFKSLIKGEQRGGTEFINKDITSTMKYIKDKVNEQTLKTKNKYIVFLYGAPGSGKTIGRKIACKLIKEQFGEILTIEEINRSFIDIGVDEIIYDLKEDSHNTRTQDKMKEKVIQVVKEYLPGDNTLTIEEVISSDGSIFTEEVLNKITEETYKIYSKHKPSADKLSDALKLFGMYLDQNIFIESSSFDESYWTNIMGL